MKIVEINFEGKKVQLHLKKISWGDHKKARRESVVLRRVEGVPNQFYDLDQMNDFKILYSIEPNADFEPNMENLEKLDEEDREALLIGILDLKSLGDEK
jgi:hypothetical protein